MESIRLYYRASCPHSRMVLAALKKREVGFELLDISNADEAVTNQLKELTGGFLSVPTIQFPDGKLMIEPSVSACMKYINANYPQPEKKESKSWFSFLKKKG